MKIPSKLTNIFILTAMAFIGFGLTAVHAEACSGQQNNTTGYNVSGSQYQAQNYDGYYASNDAYYNTNPAWSYYSNYVKPAQQTQPTYYYPQNTQIYQNTGSQYNQYNQPAPIITQQSNQTYNINEYPQYPPNYSGTEEYQSNPSYTDPNTDTDDTNNDNNNDTSSNSSSSNGNGVTF